MSAERLAAERRLVSVQYLRAAAAVGVVLYHSLQWRSGGFDVGRAGVDIFFVVSGLVLWRATAGRQITPAQFLVARASRVAPLYWLVTLGVGAVAAVWPSFLPQVRPDWRDLLLSLAFVPHLDATGRPFPTLPPGWSLVYEAAFYVLFALALALPRRLRAGALISGLAAATAAGFILADPAYILGANPLLLEFAAGVGLGMAIDGGGLRSRARGAASLALGGALLIGASAPGVFSEVWRPLLWGGPATLIVAGAVSLERGGFAPPSRSLLALGDASYALYLIHVPVCALVAHGLGTGEPGVYIPAALIASTIAALAVHRWVERPLTRACRGQSIGPLYRRDGLNRLDAAPGGR